MVRRSSSPDKPFSNKPTNFNGQASFSLVEHITIQSINELASFIWILRLIGIMHNSYHSDFSRDMLSVFKKGVIYVWRSNCRLIVGVILVLLVILLIYFLFRGRDESAVARGVPPSLAPRIWMMT